MADTTDNQVLVAGVWTNLNTLTGVPVGRNLLTNVGSNTMRVAERTTAPTIGDILQGLPLAPAPSVQLLGTQNILWGYSANGTTINLTPYEV